MNHSVNWYEMSENTYTINMVRSTSGSYFKVNDTLHQAFMSNAVWDLLPQFWHSSLHNLGPQCKKSM